jgi:telomerase reverse transcriptase
MIIKLLREHIKANIVKIGNRHYRQKDGIPQGSVLSSLLCNFFYGDMERKHLGFTKDDGSALLRYVDDFLFITTKKDLAVEFLRVMAQGQDSILPSSSTTIDETDEVSTGNPEYGCFISPDKTLTNFNATIDGLPVFGSSSPSKGTSSFGIFP